jgi:hypothetical protein
MLRHLAPVRTDVSEELSSFFIRVTRIGELGAMLVLTSNRRTLRINTKSAPKVLGSNAPLSLSDAAKGAPRTADGDELLLFLFPVFCKA